VSGLALLTVYIIKCSGRESQQDNRPYSRS
jgi:hypothetical protein